MFQTLEGVGLAGNGITAEGLKAFDGILQSNIMLKTLDLSGNPIGDDGAKVYIPQIHVSAIILKREEELTLPHILKCC